jgi:hypothetical protein
MNSEPVIVNSEPPPGPVFVDSSGRRARLLRRAGILLGVACIGYAAVLGMAFMGWGGSSLTPSGMLPFGLGPGTQAGASQPDRSSPPGGPGGRRGTRSPSPFPSPSAS